MISSFHVSLAAKLAALGHSGHALGQLFVKLSSQGVLFGQRLRPQRVGLSAHFAVPGSSVAEVDAWF